MNGALVVDKPVGPTSHDVVARLRRALGERRIGHTGTLDPIATGVLVLLVGPATRLSQFLVGADKGYEATIRLGLTTDTYDVSGQPVPLPAGSVPPSAIDRVAVEAALEPFRGTFLQAPPPFSAKKIGGERAYALARRRVEPAPAPVPVSVLRLDLIDVANDRVEIVLECSRGFYVRALAHELGERLRCGAALERLRRTRSGVFDLDMTAPLEVLERDPAAARSRLLPAAELLPALPAVALNERGARRARHGNDLGPGDMTRAVPGLGAHGPGARMRLLDPAGALLGVAERRPGGALHPVVVLV